MNCHDCKFFEPENEHKLSGFCRRYPAKIEIHWSKGDWCGEFSATEAKVKEK
jgi:hypothetical protein